jgi:hypothetical protein
VELCCSFAPSVVWPSALGARNRIAGRRVLGPDSLDTKLYVYLDNAFIKRGASHYPLCRVVVWFAQYALRRRNMISWDEG